MKILIPVSLGELYDKISILEIKMLNMDSPEKIANVSNEYNQLKKVAEAHPINDGLYQTLYSINKLIWDVEDEKRNYERRQKFEEGFIKVSRDVHFLNDERAAIKKNINTIYESDIVEEKSYKKY